MATRPEQLYKDDFYAWTREQAGALRRLADQRWNGPLDLLHLAEEVEDFGSEQRWAVESQLERVIEHLLYRQARRNANLALLDHGEEAARALPQDCPYSFDELLAEEWWPANRHGLRDDD